MSKCVRNLGESIGFKFIPNESELFRAIPEFIFKPLRVFPNQSENPFLSFLMKNSQKSIRLNPIQSGRQYKWIQNNFSIRINRSLDWIGLSQINFDPFFIKRNTKCFSDWFGMTWNGSEKNPGMSQNSFNLLGMNFNPILSPGRKHKIISFPLNLPSNFFSNLRPCIRSLPYRHYFSSFAFPH